MYSKDRSTVIDRREMLRVKVKSLAEEARIIRREEQRSLGRTYHTGDIDANGRAKQWHTGGYGGPIYKELHAHRTGELRNEARHAHLALGFIKGRALLSMEQPSTWGQQGYASPPDWDHVRRLIRKYGPADFDFGALIALQSATTPQPSEVELAGFLG